MPHTFFNNAQTLNVRSAFFVSCSVVMMTVGCYRLDNVERGQFRGSRRFDFENLITLEVRSATNAAYEFKRYNIKNGDAFHVPTDRLTIATSGGGFVVTEDRKGTGNCCLEVNGSRYRVPLHHLLLIDEAGTIRMEGGEDRRIIHLISESEAYKYKTQ